MIKDLIEHNFMPDSPNKKTYTSLRAPREISVAASNEPRVPQKKSRPHSAAPKEIKQQYDKLKLMLQHIRFPSKFN